MATLGDKGRIMIRKRAAPNILTKKEKASPQADPNLKLEDNVNAEVESSQASSSDSMINSSVMSEEVTKDPSNKAETPECTHPVDLPDTSKEVESNTVSSTVKQIRKRVAPILPRKRLVPNLPVLSQQRNPQDPANLQSEEHNIQIAKNSELPCIEKVRGEDSCKERTNNNDEPSDVRQNSDDIRVDESHNKISSNKFLKRRLLPKLDNKTSEINSKSNLADYSTLVENNVENLSASCSDKSLTPEDKSSSHCSITKNPGSATLPNSGPQETEGVLRVYLNCWPEYPLPDDLLYDPLYEDRKVQECGKVSVFTKNNHHIAYCDLKSTVDIKNVPKNWAYVNFNKLIKEEFFTNKNDGELMEKGVVINPGNQVESSNSWISHDKECDESEHSAVQSNNEIIQSENSDIQGTKSTSPDNLSFQEVGNTTADEMGECESGDCDSLTINEINSGIEKSIRDECSTDFENSVKTRSSKKCGILDNNSVNSENDSHSCQSGDSEGSECLVNNKTKRKKLNNSSKTAKKARIVKHNKTKKIIKKKISEKVKVSPTAPFPQKLSESMRNKLKWDQHGNCAEPDKLELKDFIYYVPQSEPMSKDEKKELNMSIEDEKEEEPEEERHGPKLIVKDGKIVVDPKSTKIKQTPIIQIKPEKLEKVKESNDPWEVQETMKFYGTLWKYGIDFSMLLGTFPNKSRDSIKKKFHYENKNNPSLFKKTLTKELDIKAVLREVIHISTIDKIHRKKTVQTPKPELLKKPRHCLLPKKRGRGKKDAYSKEKKPKLENSVMEDECSVDSVVPEWINQSEIIISDNINNLNLSDVITFSTNVVYKDMNIVESVSFHPSAIQPVDVNVTICHEPKSEPVAHETLLQKL